MFQTTITLFNQYCQRLSDAGISFQGDAVNEVGERLQHLTYLVERVRQLERQTRELMTRGTEAIQFHLEEIKKAGIEYDPANVPAAAKRSPEEFKDMNVWTTEAQIFIEAFYYFAGRIRSLLRHKSEPIPGLGSFECEGVRNVRNHLIEHPEGGNSLVLIRSFGWVGDNGPVVKAVRYSHQEKVFPDAGLYRNADVLKANLERLLRRDPTISWRKTLMNQSILFAVLATLSPLAFAATPAIVDANGTTLGTPLRVATDPTQVTVATRTGFVVNFVSGTGQLAANVQDPIGNRIFSNEPYFESIDCTGQGYLPIGPGPGAIAGGVVMGADASLWGASTVFIPKNPPATIRTLRSSRYIGSACTDRSAFPFVGAAAIPTPNVPITTGVAGPAALPMRLEIVSDCVFSNGFQCPAG